MRSLALSLVALVACAPAARSQDSTGSGRADLPPAGYGTLSQDDIAVTLRQEALEIRMLPLDERVLRLLAPDAYRSLHELVRSRTGPIDSVGRINGVSSPGLMLVTFFGRKAGARFDPQNVYVTIRNQLNRPIGVVPFSPNFTSQQLGVRESATGLLLFEIPIPVYEVFSLSYGVQASQSWESRLSKLQRERERVTAKVQQDTTAGPPPR